jgi:hypothetical protein
MGSCVCPCTMVVCDAAAQCRAYIFVMQKRPLPTSALARKVPRSTTNTSVLIYTLRIQSKL